MAKKGNKEESFRKHIGSAIFANLLASLVLAIAYFLVFYPSSKSTSEQPTSKLLVTVAALALWCISCGLVVLLVRHGKPFKKNLKYIGYYFPLTTLFVWAFDQRSLRRKAEEKLRRLEMILEGWPDVRIIAGIIDPEKQRDTLSKIIDKIDNMEDRILAQILENIRRYADDILGSIGANENYDIFRQVMEKVSLLEPDERPQTYTFFLWLLSDVFIMPPKRCFTRRVQKDMIVSLKNAIWRVDRSHLNCMWKIIEQIMADKEDEHDVARQILELLLHLDWKEKREVWQIIFDESMKRAFRFPQGFGFEFLSTLRQLEHKVFWLDTQSLRLILEQTVKNAERGLINLKAKAYDALCSTVFAPLEDEEYGGIRSCRVFRRLKTEDGRVQVECTFPDGKVCTCEAESLSFRGLYSKKCLRKEGEKLKAKVIPIVEVGQPKAKHEFALMASVTKLHPVEASTQSEGRGIFFEDGEEDVVKDLYEYISEHRK